MSKIDWEKWNDTLNTQSSLLLVAMISATGLQPVVAAIISGVLLTIFFVFTLPVAKKLFGRRDELRRLKESSGLKEEEIEEFRVLSEKNPGIGNVCVYMICMLTSMGLLVYNIWRFILFFENVKEAGL